jgi:hypothetical protein
VTKTHTNRISGKTRVYFRLVEREGGQLVLVRDRGKWELYFWVAVLALMSALAAGLLWWLVPVILKGGPTTDGPSLAIFLVFMEIMLVLLIIGAASGLPNASVTSVRILRNENATEVTRLGILRRFIPELPDRVQIRTGYFSGGKYGSPHYSGFAGLRFTQQRTYIPLVYTPMWDTEAEAESEVTTVATELAQPLNLPVKPEDEEVVDRGERRGSLFTAALLGVVAFVIFGGIFFGDMAPDLMDKIVVGTIGTVFGTGAVFAVWFSFRPHRKAKGHARHG